MNRSQKKGLVFAPVMSTHAQTNDLLKMLSFLDQGYHLDIIDPLQPLSTLLNDAFYETFWDVFPAMMSNYDVFIGFSFGGIILQQCFPIMTEIGQGEKKVVLFSVPTFADTTLYARLSQVIHYAEAAEYEQAHTCLMEQVLHPNPLPQLDNTCDDAKLACERLKNGLTRVITTDSSDIMSSTTVRFHHFIGDQSYLVNRNHVITPPSGNLIIVPEAGMRVLQDNMVFCQSKLLEIMV